jgi:predicted nucleotidyltransferase
VKSFDDLNLSKKEKLMLRAIKEAVQRITPDAEVVFFGSRARGEVATESDWDILILTDNVTYELKDEICATLYDLELENEIIINPLILDKREWTSGLFSHHPIHRNVEREGMVIR